MVGFRFLKSIFRETPLYAIYSVHKQNRLYREWVKAGKPAPPPLLAKQQTIKEYARKFNLSVFIETGTALGDMVYAVKDVFAEIYSIELGMELYRHAQKRFAGVNHIAILQGDSSQILVNVLAQVKKPCLFWLDAHYSGGITAKGALETPIALELDCIFSHPMARDHIILIDDARCFTGENGYPSIIALRDLADQAGFGFEIKEDIIRIYDKARNKVNSASIQ